MATVAAPRCEMRPAEHRFYSRMALFLATLAFLAFAPSFYLRDIVPAFPRPNPTLPLTVILHGVLFTLWMLPLMLWDRRSLGHVHAATWLGSGPMAASILVTLGFLATGTWAPIARHLPGV